MAKKKQSKRKPTLTFRVKDVIEAMNIVLEDYGNIPVVHLLGNCIPMAMNCVTVNRKDKEARLAVWDNEDNCRENLVEGEEFVFCVQWEEEK